MRRRRGPEHAVSSEIVCKWPLPRRSDRDSISDPGRRELGCPHQSRTGRSSNLFERSTSQGFQCPFHLRGESGGVLPRIVCSVGRSAGRQGGRGRGSSVHEEYVGSSMGRRPDVRESRRSVCLSQRRLLRMGCSVRRRSRVPRHSRHARADVPRIRTSGSTDGWYKTVTNSANTQSVCLAFGQYLAMGHGSFTGFANRPNIIWINGGDTFPANGTEGALRALQILKGP